MSKEKYTIAFNSAIIYVIAFMSSTILHEFAHGLAGLFNGSDPVIHHNYVEHLTTGQLTAQQQVFIALSGPSISLFQGFAFAGVFLNSRKRGFINLFFLWFSVLGFNNFLGYLMTGPLFAAGDIGKVYSLLNAAVWLQVLLALCGAAGLLFVAYKMTTPFLEFSYRNEWISDGESRKKFSFCMIIIPWILGSATMTFLYLPVIAIVSIIYPVMSGFVFIFPWQNAQRTENVRLSDSKEIGSYSIPVIASFLLLIVIFKWVLAPGISL